MKVPILEFETTPGGPTLKVLSRPPELAFAWGKGEDDAVKLGTDHVQVLLRFIALHYLAPLVEMKEAEADAKETARAKEDEA